MWSIFKYPMRLASNVRNYFFGVPCEPSDFLCRWHQGNVSLSDLPYVATSPLFWTPAALNGTIHYLIESGFQEEKIDILYHSFKIASFAFELYKQSCETPALSALCLAFGVAGTLAKRKEYTYYASCIAQFAYAAKYTDQAFETAGALALTTLGIGAGEIMGKKLHQKVTNTTPLPLPASAPIL